MINCLILSNHSCDINSICGILLLGDQDYNITLHTITLPAKKTSFTFYIQIINDDTLEDPEDFSVTIDSSKTLHRNRVTLIAGSLHQAKVLIMDDNGE